MTDAGKVSSVGTLTLTGSALTLTSATAATWSTSAGALVIDGAGGLTLDSDGTDAVNLGTEAAAKTITIGNAASAEVQIDAIRVDINAVANGWQIDGAGNSNLSTSGTGTLTIDSAGALVIDTDGTDNISLGTEAAAKTITIGNDASTKVDVNALAIELDSAGIIVANSVGSTTITAGAASTWSTSAGALTLNGTGGLVLQEGGAAILGISDARAVTLENAASIDIDASGAVAIDSSAGSMTMGAILADGQTLTLGKAGAVEMSLAPHGTASNEKFTLANTAGSATNAVKVEALAGGIDIDAKLVLALDGEGGVNLGIATSGAAVSIGHATSETTVNDNLTVTGDLTVNGATVTIDTTNLSVQDPVITLNEGGQALNANGGLLFTSGSSLAAKPGVAFGRVANDTWGLGQIAVPSSGTMTTVAGMTTSGMALRAGKFQLDSAADYMELDTNIKIVAAADIILDPGGNNVLPGSDAADDLGAAGTQWKDLYVHGIGYIDQIGTDADPVAGYFNAGELDGVIIGSESAAAATFTTCDATTDFTIDGLVLTADTITNDAALTVVSTGFTVNASLDIALSADGGNVTMDDGTTTVFDFNVDDSKMKIQDPAQVANYLEVAVAANGATTMTTVDADAAAANLIITADGTFEAVGTTITLDSGGAINLEPAGGSAILLDGTISIDGGVVTGATSITSTNFDGIIGADNARAGTFALVTGTSLDVNGAADISGVTDLAAAGVATNVRGTLAVIQQADFTANLDATGGVDIDADNIKLTVGAGADLEMVHNGSATSIKNMTGMLRIESNGGNLVLSSSATNSEIQFGDAYNGNILTNGLFQLSDSAAEWNTYVSNFAANKSLVGALNSLASGGTRSKFQYAVTGSHSANIPLWINASLDHDQGTGGPAALDVFVNGQLLTSGTTVANGDYKIGIADADRVQFFFALESGDQVTINKP
jgi:hypothetical protein